MPKAKEVKQTVRRVIKDNSVTFIAAGLLILLLATLILSRYGALYSIRDIANINPLITTGSTELIAVDVNGVIKIAKDDDGVASEVEKKSDATSNDTSTNKPATGSGGSSSGSGGTGGGAGGGTPTGGAGGNSGGSGNPGGSGNSNGGNDDNGGDSQPTPMVTVSVGQLDGPSEYLPLISIGSRSKTYTTNTDIVVSNPSDSKVTVQYRWSRGEADQEIQYKEFGKGTNRDRVSHSWSIPCSTPQANKTIFLKVTSPITVTKQITFYHRC